jgi:hypothetical protein
MFYSHNVQRCFYDLIFGIVLANSLVYEAYFVVGDLFVELLGLCMLIYCLCIIFLFMISLGMSGYFSTGPL